jgi:hypothetical protein
MKSKLAIICMIVLLLTSCASSKSTSTTEEIGWDKAKEMILTGAVETLSQTHDRKVMLDLKDGSRFTTTEPTLDDIFKVVEQCGKKCSNISMITE